MNEVAIGELLDRIRSANRETEWIEFKVNDDSPEDIGEYVSALSNSTTLHGKRNGYLVWGINNVTHDVVGTTVSLRTAKVGNEELESWLLRLLTPRIDFRIHEGVVDGKNVVILQIPPATHTPVRFKSEEYIRVGSYKKRLKDFPEKERELWRVLERYSFEKEIASEHVPGAQVLTLLDFPSYFELTHRPMPESLAAVLEDFAADDLVERNGSNSFHITNLGALLFARKLSEFPTLKRKAVRVISYKDKSRVETVREREGDRGYAAGFANLIAYLNVLLPANEQITKAIRAEVRMYPEIAIRELIANALIHQDFRMTGVGPLVEVFTDRIEITNPGVPLIETKRFIDAPPRSRNEKLAALMRRMNVCEERGSGIDKVISSIEIYQLPPPRFDVPESHTKATLFAARKLSEMDREDRLRACYQHACLRYVSGERMTNTSLRERLGIEVQNYSMASRIISEAIAEKLVKREDPESKSNKHARYVPYWA
jgi:ATP-dependent DNA helicase RecG